MITIEVKGIDDLLKTFGKIDFFFKRGVSKGINESLKLLKMRASDNLDLTSLNVYPHDKSQSINANWRIASPYERDPTILGGTTTDVLTGVLYNISRHAGYVELGTGRSLNPAGKDPGSPDVKVLSSLRSGHKKLFTADVIRPKSAQALKFADVGGEFIYSKYVEGQPPKHYLRQAMLMSGKEIKDAIRYYSWDIFKDIESNVRF